VGFDWMEVEDGLVDRWERERDVVEWEK